MTLCIPTLGTAQYISIISCILFLIKVKKVTAVIFMPAAKGEIYLRDVFNSILMLKPSCFPLYFYLIFFIFI